MAKIIINSNPMFNSRYYSEEMLKKALKEYQIKILKQQRIDKLNQLIKNI